ncbi:MAG: hypothetical protein RBR20_04155 [Desulfobacterales bacterium]|jgi:hypothetical protein|nr:hypothetical protein [Desulfobacteraceae bacterium]MDD3991421.1 hypothetical protein [Desulfobacteraceae bacterium]MDY0311298.1 hypothetical protein [Desulfobacterales bacterium]
MTRTATISGSASGLKRLYGVTLVVLAISGFAQMPIFKRYYIADIPGLGWLAQYYVTHLIHYLGAALLLGLVAYVVTGWLSGRPRPRLTGSGIARGVLLVGLIVTGVLRVIKNFSGIYMSADWIVFLDMLHIALVMAYFVAAAWAAVGKKRWTTQP